MELSKLDISKTERDVIVAQTQLDILEAELAIGATDEATVEAARRDFFQSQACVRRAYGTTLQGRGERFHSTEE